MEDGYAFCKSPASSSADEEKAVKKTRTSSIKKWNERNTTLLINLLKENLHFGICLIVNAPNAKYVK